MSMYSVLMVDDEEDVIRAMQKKIDWESIGFRIMGYAHNGIEALDLVEQETPDVVLTDIKMPYMDGLELAHNLKAMYPTVRILIFSGFDEFEYAKEAIRLEVEEYVLKPVDADELRRVFLRIKESLDQEMDEKRNVQKLRDYYMESLPLLRENFYSTLINGKMPESEIERYLEDLQIELKGPMHVALVLHTSTSQVPEGMSAVLLTESVRRLARERLAEKWDARMFPNEGNVVLLVPCASPEDVTRITDEAESFCRLAGHVCQALVTIGVGKPCEKLSELPESYRGAREAVSYRALYGAGKAINIGEIEPGGQRSADNSQKKLLALFKAIKMGGPGDVKDKTEECVDEMTYGSISLSTHRFLVMGLVSSLYRFAISNHLEPEPIFGEDESLFRNVTNMDAVQLRKWLYDCSIKMHSQIRDNRADSSQTFVSRAIEYVRDNYGDQELTIDKICGILGVSAAYFSTTFKKETGKTFIAYLTDYRMDQAVQRLIEKNEKTYVIAAQVGYADPAYFSYVFKKRFGVSPSRYRSERK